MQSVLCRYTRLRVALTFIYTHSYYLPFYIQRLQQSYDYSAERISPYRLSWWCQEKIFLTEKYDSVIILCVSSHLLVSQQHHHFSAKVSQGLFSYLLRIYNLPRANKISRALTQNIMRNTHSGQISVPIISILSYNPDNTYIRFKFCILSMYVGKCWAEDKNCCESLTLRSLCIYVGVELVFFMHTHHKSENKCEQ